MEQTKFGHCIYSGTGYTIFMDDKGKELLRHLISELEGAPYPHLMENELYSIWYDHVQATAHEALEYLNSFQETERE